MVRRSLLVLAVAVCSRVAAAGQADHDREQAIVHFNAGNEAFSRGNTHEAYREYRTAWQLNRAFDIACNLGRAEAELGKLTESAQHLRYCLDNFSASPQPHVRGARQKYAELFATVKAQVASVGLTVTPDGAEVSIDGERVGTTPLAHHVYLTPGMRRIEVRMPGYRELKWEVPATAGETRELNLQLEPLTANAEQPAVGDPYPVESAGGQELHDDAPVNPGSARAKRIALVSGSALTLLGAGVGVGFYLHAPQLDDEARALRRSIQKQAPGEPAPCSGDRLNACSELADTVERRERASDWSKLGFVATGAFAIGTVAAWLFWPAPKPASAASSLTAIPVVSEHTGGLVVVGDF